MRGLSLDAICAMIVGKSLMAEGLALRAAVYERCDWTLSAKSL